ncbi:MAG: hypothetical protein PHP64_00760 [Actinomycetota bacterium]|nr:hypothetical protein [Actinomycetota bacterium]
MLRCKICGFPRRYSSVFEWQGDGTILASQRLRMPLMFLEVNEWDFIFNELTSKVGSPVEHILIEAQKNVGKTIYEIARGLYMNIDVKRIPSFLKLQFLAKLLIWSVRNYVAAMGAGSIGLVSYKAGESATLSFINPCLIPMVVGNCLGIYECVEEMPGSSAEYKVEGGTLYVRMSHAEESRVSAERLYLEEPSSGEGKLTFEKCRCGVPERISQSFIWNLEAGEIRNKKTGMREGMVAVQSMNAILRELAHELGEEVLDMLYDSQKQYSRQKLESKKAETANHHSFWNEYLSEMGARGFGYPVSFQTTESSVSVEIKSAYNQILYAAKIAGAVEALTDRNSNITWGENEPSYGKYTISAE